MSQTSYSLYIPAVSYPGQMADDCQVKDVLSGMAYLAPIIYGVLCVTDEANTAGFDQLAAKVPSAAADITTVGAQLGVSLAQQAIPQNPAVAVPSYRQYDAVSCLRMGRVWVNAETAMADGLNPYIRYGAGGSGYNGSFAGAAGANLAQMAAGQAVVRGTTSGAGYAVIELNIA